MSIVLKLPQRTILTTFVIQFPYLKYFIYFITLLKTLPHFTNILDYLRPLDCIPFILHFINKTHYQRSKKNKHYTRYKILAPALEWKSISLFKKF